MSEYVQNIPAASKSQTMNNEDRAVRVEQFGEEQDDDDVVDDDDDDVDDDDGRR